jgi:hypothetical protein
MSKQYTMAYSRHYRDDAEGHIFINKEGACTITLTPAQSMSQEELNYFGEMIVDSVNGGGFLQELVQALADLIAQCNEYANNDNADLPETHYAQKVIDKYNKVVKKARK